MHEAARHYLESLGVVKTGILRGSLRIPCRIFMCRSSNTTCAADDARANLGAPENPGIADRDPKFRRLRPRLRYRGEKR